MLDFDPRTVEDRSCDVTTLRAQVQQLTATVPDTCLRQVWGVHPPPPDFIAEVIVECNATLEQQAEAQVYEVGMVPVAMLTQRLDGELIQFIDELTQLQDKSNLWHKLRVGRITSSMFGQVFRTKNSPSLLNSILSRK